MMTISKTQLRDDTAGIFEAHYHHRQCSHTNLKQFFIPIDPVLTNYPNTGFTQLRFYVLHTILQFAQRIC